MGRVHKPTVASFNPSSPHKFKFVPYNQTGQLPDELCPIVNGTRFRVIDNGNNSQGIKVLQLQSNASWLHVRTIYAQHGLQHYELICDWLPEEARRYPEPEYAESDEYDYDDSESLDDWVDDWSYEEP